MTTLEKIQAKYRNLPSLEDLQRTKVKLIKLSRDVDELGEDLRILKRDIRQAKRDHGLI